MKGWLTILQTGEHDVREYELLHFSQSQRGDKVLANIAKSPVWVVNNLHNNVEEM